MSRLTILHGDVREKIKEIPDELVQCVVTSPPYWGLRSYLPKDHPDKHKEIGQEKTPAFYVQTMVELFHEIRRTLKNDGTVWLNLGDCYARDPGKGIKFQAGNKEIIDRQAQEQNVGFEIPNGLKAKDLIGIPWRVALALQADGWYLRSDIIWAKPNCMPESVTDRPTRSHEYIFLLTKSAKYFYDHEAIKEPASYDVDGTGTAARKARQNVENKSMPTSERGGIRPPAGYKNSVNFDGKNSGKEKQRGHSRRRNGLNDRWDKMTTEEQCIGMRNKRDVWIVPPAQYRDAHFAVFPPDLIRPCILACSRKDDLVMDPFGGSGTTARVAIEEGRRAILVELNADYLPMIDKRTDVTVGLGL